MGRNEGAAETPLVQTALFASDVGPKAENQTTSSLLISGFLTEVSFAVMYLARTLHVPNLFYFLIVRLNIVVFIVHQGLPSDSFSTENGVTVTRGSRYWQKYKIHSSYFNRVFVCQK